MTSSWFKSKKNENKINVDLPTKGKCSDKCQWLDYIIPTDDEIKLLSKLYEQHTFKQYFENENKDNLVLIFNGKGSISLTNKESFINDYFILEEIE